jgi:calcium/calmodulin-dependent protein kinase (CaM kinase) II
MNDAELELLTLNQRLLDSIARADWQTYAELCDPSLTCFEPEASGQLVHGLPFHEYFFRFGPASDPHQTTMASPHVRIMSDAAVVAYVRLNQRVNSAGTPVVTAVEETRIWQKQAGKWHHVHFHRSSVRAG